MKKKGLRSFSLTSDYCSSCELKKRLHLHQFTNCYPNEENVGDDYDEEDDLFEESLDGSNDDHCVDDDNKELNNALQELQSLNLKEKKVRLTRGQRRAAARKNRNAAKLKRRAATRLRKKLKKNNGEDGVNSITDEVRYSVTYYNLYY